MPVTFEELKTIQSQSNYAKYFQANLHVHTPATPWDWDAVPKQTRKASSITPEIFFEELNKTNLDLVAITDHNCVLWCEKLVELAEKARKRGLSKLYILPGVEISTYEGPHLIAIFDEKKDVREINDMLKLIGLSGNGNKEERCNRSAPLNQVTFNEVFEVVLKHGGLFYAPHIQTDLGLWGCKTFKGRNEIFNDKRLRILSAPSGQIKKVHDGSKTRLLFQNMDSDQINNSFAFVNTSDSHRIEDLEENTTWIKMGIPSFEGVRQIIFEPELRVSHTYTKSIKTVAFPDLFNFEKPALESNFPYIIGIAVDGGMLDQNKVALSPNLNCVIGKNYAGKSAFLDCIRFALNTFSSTNDEIYYSFVNRLRAFIGEGGQVRVYFQTSECKICCSSRVLLCSFVGGYSGKEKWKIESSPEVHTLIKGNFIKDSGSDVLDIFQLEAYPQGEVIRIKDNATKQMAILNSLGNLESDISRLLEPEISGEITLLGEIIENGQSILEILEKISENTLKVGDIKDLEIEISRLEGLASNTNFEKLKKCSDLESYIKIKKAEIQTIQNNWILLNNVEFEKEADTKETDILLIDEFSKQKNIIDKIIEKLMEKLSSNKTKALALIEGSLLEISTKESDLTKMHQQCVADLLKQDEANSDFLDTLIEKISEKKQTLQEERQISEQISLLEKEISVLQDERKLLLDKFDNEFTQISNKRKGIIKSLNEFASSSVQVELLEKSDRNKYYQVLDDIVSRISNPTNKIMNKQSQLMLIVNNITPRELVRIVNENIPQTLIDKCNGVSENTARVITNMGLENTYLLETCLVEDLFKIKYRKEGDESFTPIDSGLSGGEQAIALLSVAMVPKKMPLLIDQPEDELGPGLITKEFVEQIRNVKISRQLIFVTHIPNIPVLSDCEQVLNIVQKIQAELKCSRISETGSLENAQIIARLLELDGGKIAFSKRSERYSHLITEE